MQNPAPCLRGIHVTQVPLPSTHFPDEQQVSYVLISLAVVCGYSSSWAGNDLPISQSEILPGKHLVAAGCIEANNLAGGVREYFIGTIWRARSNCRWQEE
jgi:hypothetical protein